MLSTELMFAEQPKMTYLPFKPIGKLKSVSLGTDLTELTLLPSLPEIPTHQSMHQKIMETPWYEMKD